MRTAPAVTVDTAPEGLARLALCGLGSAAVSVCMLWAWMRHDAAGWVTFAGVVALVAAVLRRAWARPVLRLRWDGQCWWLGPASSQAEPQPGDVAVALDLGPWMLLRFRAALPAARPGHRWLPLQRSALPAQWHALRCAAYSPRPRRAAVAEGNVRA